MCRSTGVRADPVPLHGHPAGGQEEEQQGAEHLQVSRRALTPSHPPPQPQPPPRHPAPHQPQPPSPSHEKNQTCKKTTITQFELQFQIFELQIGFFST